MRLYRALLRLYPASFRAEYGADMLWIFAERRRAASGLRAAAVLWLGALAEALRNAIPAHADILRQDVRYAVRALSRAPGFTITATLVFALGIACTTATFTLTDHVLVRPLPYPASDRLVKLYETPPGYRLEASPPNYADWRRISTVFEGMAAYRGLSVSLVGRGDPTRLEGSSVTADLFSLLGVRPALGRGFSRDDDRDGAQGTVLLSDGLWRSHFAADPRVLGARVLLDDQPYIVIGVMPAGFAFPSRTATLWTSMRFAPSDLEDRDNNYLHVLARLKPGVSIEQARGEMAVVAEQLERTYPDTNEKTGAVVIRLRDQVSPQGRILLAALSAGAFCVLLIACTNLAHLLVARFLSRQTELAVRRALGADRERLVRQLLTETLLLATVGGFAGVVAAFLALPLLTRLVPESLPIAGVPSLDLRVLALAVALTLATGLGFGVVPALRASHDADTARLRQGARAGADRRRERLRAGLVVVEVTTTVVLLIAARLLIRALVRVHGTDPGFRSDGVLTLRTWLPNPKYDSVARREAFYRRVLDGARALPNVTDAAYTSYLPMTMRGGIWPVAIDGRVRTGAGMYTASLRFVTPGFFRALGIPITMGRDVSSADTSDKQIVAVVSESFARTFWPGENAIGRRFTFGFVERTVVGVVGNVRVRGLEGRSEPQVYLPSAQVPDGALVNYTPKDLVVRSTADPRALVPELRRIVTQADRSQPISDVQLLSEIVAGDTMSRRVHVRILGAFAALAFLLAAVGLHGLMSFTVSQRAHEIGIRLALGAQWRDVLSMVLRESLLLAGLGLVLGVAAGYAAGRSMETLLAGVAAGDSATYLAAIGLALAMTLVGTLVPAIRALRVAPIDVLRAGP